MSGRSTWPRACVRSPPLSRSGPPRFTDPFGTRMAQEQAGAELVMSLLGSPEGPGKARRPILTGVPR